VVIIFALSGRLFFVQIVNGQELKKSALEQWTKSIDIKSNRGIIFDRNGKKLATNVTAYTVWAYPAEIKDKEIIAETISNILVIEKELVLEKLNKKVSAEKIKQWISRDEAIALRQENIRGISVVDDSKRYYPLGSFASHILGFTDIDNNGLDAIEKTYDKYLAGTPGKLVRTTDAANRQLPYDGEKVYDSKDGLSAVLTIDEAIQHFAEREADQAIIRSKPKNISIIIMEPKTGDILALVNKPDYDPNAPREPLDSQTKAEWDALPQEEVQKKWYEMWRNYAINDIYEPGSTFKIVTASAALEEGTSTLHSHYYCNGFIRDIKGVTLKCASWYNPHGDQTFAEAIKNSCNVAFVNIARGLGKEKMLEYVKAFGFGEKSGVDLLGEQSGIIPANTDMIKEVNLATMSYGHGIAVTPLQMVNAMATIANGGNLMEPRLVKQLVDFEGNVVENFEPVVKRTVLSKQTADTMMELLEGVVDDGTGKNAYVAGYRVGGKTGTAQKIINGRYAPGKYIASFVAAVPADDPKMVILVIVDEPTVGSYYGGSTAAPIAKKVIEDTLKYLEVEPIFTEEELENIDEQVVVPDIRKQKINEVGKKLSELGLRYTTEYQDITTDSIILDQFPLPGTKVLKGSIIDLYLNERPNKIIMPDLIGKTKDEVINILDGLNLQYTLEGTGKAFKQNTETGKEIDSNTKIIVEFSNS